MALANREVLFESADEVKAALESSLQAIDAQGSFAAIGALEEANPGLEIETLGRFGVPLSQSEISRIIGESRQAPFGKGSDTIVDTTVRRTWEIDANRIKLGHPKWQSQENAILSDVCSQLGIPRGSEYVRMELYKLLVYGEGAMFNPRKDTEKAPGMFGTLVSTIKLATFLSFLKGFVRENHVVGKDDLMVFRRLLHELNMHVEVDLLYEKIASESEQMDAQYFESTLLPKLTHAVTLMKERCIPLNTLAFRNVLRAVLLQYVTRVVQAEPTTPRNWARETRGCGCADCQSLDKFLTDPNTQLFRLRAGEQRRRHLESRFDTSYSFMSGQRRPCSPDRDYLKTMERTGSPHTLVIQKTRTSY